MTNTARITNPSSATQSFQIDQNDGSSAPGGGDAVIRVMTGQFPRIDPKAIEDAVFGYITAVRALGRTTINTNEIATALGLSLELVESTIASLQARNIRIAP